MSVPDFAQLYDKLFINNDCHDIFSNGPLKGGMDNVSLDKISFIHLIGYLVKHISKNNKYTSYQDDKKNTEINLNFFILTIIPMIITHADDFNKLCGYFNYLNMEGHINNYIMSKLNIQKYNNVPIITNININNIHIVFIIRFINDCLSKIDNKNNIFYEYSKYWNNIFNNFFDNLKTNNKEYNVSDYYFMDLIKNDINQNIIIYNKEIQNNEIIKNTEVEINNNQNNESIKFVELNNNQNNESIKVVELNNIPQISSVNDSSVNDSSVNDSSVNDGSVNDGSVNNNSVNDGSVNDGSVNNVEQVKHVSFNVKPNVPILNNISNDNIIMNKQNIQTLPKDSILPNGSSSTLPNGSSSTLPNGSSSTLPKGSSSTLPNNKQFEFRFEHNFNLTKPSNNSNSNVRSIIPSSNNTKSNPTIKSNIFNLLSNEREKEKQTEREIEQSGSNKKFKV